MKPKRKNRRLSLLFIYLSILSSLILAVSFGSPTAAYQAPNFYYYYTEKIHLNVSAEMVTIRFADNLSKEAKEALIRADAGLRDISDEKLPFGLVLAITKEGADKEAVTQAVERLNKLPEVKYCTPVFQYRHLTLILTDEFIVRFKTDMTSQEIETLNKKHGVSIVRVSPYRHNRYVLRVMNPKHKSVLEMANIYNQLPQTEYGTPNFLVIGGYCNTYPDDTYGPKVAPDGGENIILLGKKGG